MIEIREFRPEDQPAVRALILAGLEERWGTLDESLNPDLRDLKRAYGHGVILVAWLNGEVVGTGTFIPRSQETVEIVRMSVARAWRRQGIGRRILESLCRRARQAGYRSAILETTAGWRDAVAFYEQFGFRRTHRRGADVYFVLELGAFLD